jgi:hypothetical protein
MPRVDNHSNTYILCVSNLIPKIPIISIINISFYFFYNIYIIYLYSLNRKKEYLKYQMESEPYGI